MAGGRRDAPLRRSGPGGDLGPGALRQRTGGRPPAGPYGDRRRAGGSPGRGLLRPHGEHGIEDRRPRRTRAGAGERERGADLQGSGDPVRRHRAGGAAGPRPSHPVASGQEGRVTAMSSSISAEPHVETGLLLLADISGYTTFLENVAAAHPELALPGAQIPPAYPIMATLLDVIVDQVSPMFQLAEL